MIRRMPYPWEEPVTVPVLGLEDRYRIALSGQVFSVNYFGKSRRTVLMPVLAKDGVVLLLTNDGLQRFYTERLVQDSFGETNTSS